MTSIDPILALADLGVVLVFALIAIASRAIDKGGFLASVAVGYSILLGGGWKWFAIVATFFTLGVGFTFFKYEYKKSIGSAQEKGGSRNWPNIIANGGVAAFFAVMELVYGGSGNAVLFLGAMSAAASDTVATELGLLSRSPPRLITDPRKRVSAGTSGGVTPLGFLGAFLASAVIGLLALLLGVLQSGLTVLVVTVFGGLVGSVGDSVLGALVQRKGFCVVCGKPCEGETHCGEAVRVTGGVKLVDNNIVNLLATIVGAAASLAIALVIMLP